MFKSRLGIRVDRSTKIEFTQKCKEAELSQAQVLRFLIRDFIDGKIKIEI